MAALNLGMVTAYGYAKAGGYTGTEQEFTALLGNIATDLSEIENLSVTVTTLPAGSSATASYSDGVLSLGIPKGDKGDQGDQGETGPTGATPQLSIGTVTTGVAGSDAAVSITGTDEEPVLNFTIPRGPSGDEELLATLYSSSKTYAVGDYCIYNDVLYKCTTAITTAEAWTAAHWTAVTVGDELTGLKADLSENYAKQDGYYQDLGAGIANQLKSDITVEDKVPYQFRTSGGSVDIGDRETDMVVGGTVAWNQLVQSKATGSQNSVTFTNNNDGTYTIDGTASADAYFVLTGALITGHKYLISNKGATNANLLQIGFTATATTTSKVISAGSANVVGFQVINGSTASSEKVTPQCTDLTIALGTTIADYVYSLETATAGAGVAWLKRHFPRMFDQYQPYETGTLESVTGVSAHEMTGFNAWDEEWEVGDISNGSNVPATGYCRSKNYIPILDTTYYFKIPSRVWVHCYDGDKNYVSLSSAGYRLITTSSSQTFPANVRYIRFVFGGTTYNHDICINISDSAKNGQYEPYEKHSYTLDDSLTLRGIPKLDANNSLYYDGDTYESDGTVTRRYGIVDLGTLTWGYDSTNQLLRAAIVSYLPSGAPIAGGYACVCPKYSKYNGTQYAGMSQGEISWGLKNYSSTYPYVLVKDSNYTDGTTFEAAMSGVYLVYELATPTTEQAEPFTNPQIVDDFGTEEYVTTSIVPVGHVTQYMANLKAKLEMAPDSPSGDGDYLVRQVSGKNEYVSLASNATIQDMLARIEALENA